jgi:dTDP-4-amino-4,6-dideoxygalactose transaminase
MGMKHCVGTAGCTAALLALATAWSFAPGDEIVVSSISDYGTIMGLVKEKYVPVFADTVPGAPLVGAEEIRACITARTRAILVVHMTGLPCDMDSILGLAAETGLPVYEDVCQGVFGQYKGRLLGSFGHAAAFSFDAEKTLSSDTSGCIVTNDDQLAAKLRFHGQCRAERAVEGFGRVHEANSYAIRMSQPAAAIALGQLEVIRPAVCHIDRMIRLLYEMLETIPGIIPLRIPDYTDLYSCWMAGFHIDPQAFRCSAAEFAAGVSKAGIPEATLARYYLLPESCIFLPQAVKASTYPFSIPPASRLLDYRSESYPNANRFLDGFIRWSSFCDKYEARHCEIAADIIRTVAEQNRR